MMDKLARNLNDLGYQTIRTWFGLRVFNSNGYEQLVINEEDKSIEFTQDTWDRDFIVLDIISNYMLGETQ